MNGAVLQIFPSNEKQYKFLLYKQGKQKFLKLLLLPELQWL